PSTGDEVGRCGRHGEASIALLAASPLSPSHPADSHKYIPANLPFMLRVAPSHCQNISDLVYRVTPGVGQIAERCGPCTEETHEPIQNPVMGDAEWWRVDFMEWEPHCPVSIRSQPRLREPEITKNLGIESVNHLVDFGADCGQLVAPAGEDAIRFG